MTVRESHCKHNVSAWQICARCADETEDGLLGEVATLRAALAKETERADEAGMDARAWEASYHDQTRNCRHAQEDRDEWERKARQALTMLNSEIDEKVAAEKALEEAKAEHLHAVVRNDFLDDELDTAQAALEQKVGHYNQLLETLAQADRAKSEWIATAGELRAALEAAQGRVRELSEAMGKALDFMRRVNKASSDAYDDGRQVSPSAIGEDLGHALYWMTAALSPAPLPAPAKETAAEHWRNCGPFCAHVNLCSECQEIHGACSEHYVRPDDAFSWAAPPAPGPTREEE